MSRTRIALLAATLLAGASGLAIAQSGALPNPLYDPAQLPTIKGNVASFTLTPRGEVDGFLLTDGTEVHVPPMVSTALVAAVHKGDAVTIHGLRARAIPMVAAASVTDEVTHQTVTVWGHGMFGRGKTPTTVSGTIKEVLHTPHGDANGALLTDGTEVRMPPPAAAKLGALLAPGKTLAVRGAMVKNALGTLVLARAAGPDAAHLTPIARPRPEWMQRMHAMMGERGQHGWADGHMGGRMGDHREGGMMGRGHGAMPPPPAQH